MIAELLALLTYTLNFNDCSYSRCFHLQTSRSASILLNSVVLDKSLGCWTYRVLVIQSCVTILIDTMKIRIYIFQRLILSTSSGVYGDFLISRVPEDSIMGIHVIFGWCGVLVCRGLPLEDIHNLSEGKFIQYFYITDSTTAIINLFEF